MNLKISGSDQREELDEIRARIRRATHDFQGFVQNCVNKKEEYHELKRQNEIERDILRKE
jgi:hypothetical protein